MAAYLSEPLNLNFKINKRTNSMKSSMKSLASLAVVGTVAVVAIFGLSANTDSNAGTFLADDAPSAEIQ